MASKIHFNNRRSSAAADDVEPLYSKLLRLLYEKQDRVAARPIARKLDALLKLRPDVRNSIRGEEIRSLVAEARGNLDDAISSREAEIRKILQLHNLVANTPNAEYAFRQYDHSDLSDRLDLLATLYAARGDFDRAVMILIESKQFCEAHQIPFDGADLLGEYETARQKPRKKKSSRLRKVRHS